LSDRFERVNAVINLTDEKKLKDRTFKLLNETYKSNPLQIFALVKNSWEITTIN
jgi:hypothetical protein